MKEYTIQAGEQNFSPPDPVGLTTRRSFRFRVAFHSSCFYSWEEWGLDRDWYDVNKLCGLTLAYTPNNHLAYMAGWMPGNIQDHILVTPYTNYPGTSFQTNRAESISIPSFDTLTEAINHQEGVLEGLVTRNSRSVHYTLKAGYKKLETRHDFRTPWYMPWIGRRVGTWFGGANNSPGRFGGRAPKAMKLWLEFETI